MTRTLPRPTRLLVALATALSLVAWTPLGSAEAATAVLADTFSAAEDVELHELINDERAARGLAPLTVNLQLTRLAREHSERMAGDDDRGGRCGDGQTLRHRSPLSGGVTAAWRILRENVGCTSVGGAPRIHQALMDSPGHKANILADDVTTVGIGTWHAQDGTFWVSQIFMRGGVEADTFVIDEGLAAADWLLRTGATVDGVVLARGDVFADSLGGAALGGADFPVLFTDAPGGDETNPVLRPSVRAAIDAVTGGTGRIYVLGGSSAVSTRAVQELRDAGYLLTRLSGSGRVETGVAIADEVVRRNGAPDRILIASASAWPDAVTGSAAAARDGIPVLLTWPDQLPPATADFLARFPDAERIVLGGTAAVQPSVADQLRATRVRGPSRMETSLEIARQLFGDVGDEVLLVEAFSEDSWGTALAWANRAVRSAAPQLLVSGDGSIAEATADWLSSLGRVSPRALSPGLTKTLTAFQSMSA